MGVRASDMIDDRVSYLTHFGMRFSGHWSMESVVLRLSFAYVLSFFIVFFSLSWRIMGQVVSVLVMG